MGNDSSRLKGLEIEKNNSVEANDFWTLFNATESPVTKNEGNTERLLLSIFQGESVVNGQLWVSHGTPMERAIKNLMIYRHPYILKYVTTWEHGGQKHLATERVRPLISVLNGQSDIQVCLGLRTILCSLIFLIEKAMARHLNIATSSIYITENGSWRLAGFEFVWKSKDINKTLLDLANSFRYQPAIDPGELFDNGSDYIEQYAFATMCEEILSKCTKSDVATPHIQDFRDYCATHLKHKNPQMRPKLSAVLLHPYFNHEFVLIHSFLFELPLKSVQERQDFFTGLIDRLRYFNEEVVGAQLAGDLLSRMVLLDPTAQLCVTPYVLKSKSDHSAALFSTATYSRHLLPQIKRMFRLRDAQIRLILLEYFMEFVRLLSKDEVADFVLPHLLEGMQDTNDVLVAKTLRCMADLVPILGSSAVLGGTRTRIFSDGRPHAAVSDTTASWVEPRSITPVMGDDGMDYMVSGSPLPDNIDLSGSFSSLAEPEDIAKAPEMTTRLSPDGGEDDKHRSVQIDGLTEAQTIAGNVIEALVQNVTSSTATASPTQTPIKSLTEEQTKGGENNRQHHDEDEDDAWSDWETDEMHRLNGDEELTLHLDSESKRTIPSSDTDNLLPSLGSATSINQLLLNSSAAKSSNPLQSDVSLSEASSSYRTAQSNASSAQSLKPLAAGAAKINDDLDALDIKVQKSTTPLNERRDEFDFFKDMEPVIETRKEPPPQKQYDDSVMVLVDESRFAAAAMAIYENGEDSTLVGDGWGVDDDVMIDVNA